jgi:hypothetical protein
MDGSERILRRRLLRDVAGILAVLLIPKAAGGEADMPNKLAPKVADVGPPPHRVGQSVRGNVAPYKRRHIIAATGTLLFDGIASAELDTKVCARDQSGG